MTPIFTNNGNYYGIGRSCGFLTNCISTELSDDMKVVYIFM